MAIPIVNISVLYLALGPRANQSRLNGRPEGIHYIKHFGALRNSHQEIELQRRNAKEQILSRKEHVDRL